MHVHVILAYLLQLQLLKLHEQEPALAMHLALGRLQCTRS